MNGNWLKLHRKATQSAVFQDRDLWHLWCYLLAHARWDPQQLPGGEWLQAGQLLFNGAAYAKQYKCHKGTVSRRLHKLVEMGNCATLRKRNCTLITVVNWAQYQDQRNSGATLAQLSTNLTVLAEKKEKEKHAPAPAQAGRAGYRVDASTEAGMEAYRQKLRRRDQP